MYTPSVVYCSKNTMKFFVSEKEITILIYIYILSASWKLNNRNQLSKEQSLQVHFFNYLSNTKGLLQVCVHKNPTNFSRWSVSK